MTFFTDSITLKKITRDKFGDEVVTSSTFSARVENTTRVITGGKGQELRPETLIMCPADFDGKKGDRVVVAALRGVATGETREREILEMFPVGGPGLSHFEVYA